MCQMEWRLQAQTFSLSLLFFFFGCISPIYVHVQSVLTSFWGRNRFSHVFYVWPILRPIVVFSQWSCVSTNHPPSGPWDCSQADGGLQSGCRFFFGQASLGVELEADGHPCRWMSSWPQRQWARKLISLPQCGWAKAFCDPSSRRGSCIHCKCWRVKVTAKLVASKYHFP